MKEGLQAMKFNLFCRTHCRNMSVRVIMFQMQPTLITEFVDGLKCMYTENCWLHYGLFASVAEFKCSSPLSAVVVI